MYPLSCLTHSSFLQGHLLPLASNCSPYLTYLLTYLPTHPPTFLLSSPTSFSHAAFRHFNSPLPIPLFRAVPPSHQRTVVVMWHFRQSRRYVLFLAFPRVFSRGFEETQRPLPAAPDNTRAAPPPSLFFCSSSSTSFSQCPFSGIIP